MLPFRTVPGAGVSSPAANAIDIWTIALDRPAHAVSALEGVLDQTERRNARRLWEGPLRSRFIVAHGAARHILARYLGCSPAAVQFDRLGSGGMCVRGGLLSFSLSHSGGLAVMAVSGGGRIGVDLELVRPVDEADNIVSQMQMFSPAEARQYAGFPSADRAAAWFSGWTRKSALLKATGESRADRRLNAFEVDLSPSASAPHVKASPDRPWFMRSFSPASGFAAAVAGDFPIESLNRREWTGPADTLERSTPAPAFERLPVNA
jgi:4'-phosphopantetheinyl transferase